MRRQNVLIEKSARVKWERPNLSLERNNRLEQSQELQDVVNQDMWGDLYTKDGE